MSENLTKNTQEILRELRKRRNKEDDFDMHAEAKKLGVNIFEVDLADARCNHKISMHLDENNSSASDLQIWIRSIGALRGKTCHEHFFRFKSKVRLQEYIQKFQELGYSTFYVHYDRDEACFTLSDNTVVSIEVREKNHDDVWYYDLSISSLMPDELNRVANLINDTYDPFKYTKIKIDLGSVYVLSMDIYKDPYLHEVRKAGTQLIRQNYSQEVLDKFDYIVEQTNSDAPYGKISIFQGEPGTGKTFLLRGLLNQTRDRKMVIVSSENIRSLASPEMMNLMIREHSDGVPITFILEDADDCLAPRGTDNLDIISKLLNLGDGIIGSCFDVRIIATTNVKIETFDPAIIRPGRLCSLVNVDKLTYDQALTCYRYHQGKRDDLPERKAYTLAEIYKIIHTERNPELEGII